MDVEILIEAVRKRETVHVTTSKSYKNSGKSGKKAWRYGVTGYK